MSARQQVSLDGTWSFVVDPAGVGERERWFERHGFDREVPVPSPWQLSGEDLIGYTGMAWYHRTFEVPAEWRSRQIALRFDAVDYEAKVWLNGRLLGTHEGGYTPFEFLLSPEGLVEGLNHLVLRAYDPPDTSEIPHGKQGSGYTRVSGPWQPVTLEARDAVHVRAVRVTPDPRAMRALAQAVIAARDGAEVQLRLLDPDGREVAVASVPASDGVAGHAFAFETVRLWSPEHPDLYRVEASVGSDAIEATFGMRWVERRDGLIHLNGEPLYIRGALDQAFYPETLYRAPGREAIEHEIRLAKAMGLNLLRKHIKLEDPRYLEACDRLGMLVWEEPACFAKDTPQARDRFRREIQAMIERDYNHPSIIAWSLYNEEWGLEWRLWRDEDKQRHVSELFDWARGLDSTRLICDNSGWAHVKTDLNDWHRYFVAPDLVDEWKADLAHCVEHPETNFVAGSQERAAGVPVLVSEFGVWGLGEVSRMTDWYGKRPWWFDAQWAGHTEEFKYPATAERHFVRYGLDRVFGTLDELSRACQQRMMRALKPIIEEMRRRPDLAGYVVTELTDIEWESNGWLDYFRKPKAGFEEFAYFNHPTAVMLELPRHNLWSHETIEGRFWVSNHTNEGYDATLRWSVPGYDGLCGEQSVRIPPFASEAVGVPLSLTAPEVRASSRAPITFTLERDGHVVARNVEELTFTSGDTVWLDDLGPLMLVGEAMRLAEPLRAAGARLVEAPSPETLVLTTTLDARTRAHLEAGGRAVFVAEHGDAAPEKDLLSFRRLPRGESRDRASSVFYLQPGLFGDLPVGGVMGWEFEGLFPHHVVPLSNYLQDLGGRGIELPSNQAAVDPSSVLAGYFEGWIGKFGAAILRMPYAQGELVVTTLRLLEGYEWQPIGTLLLHRLLLLAASPAPARAV